MEKKHLIQVLCFLMLVVRIRPELPIVLNTWAFTNATTKAWIILNSEKDSGLDALVEGCSVCEREQCDGTVGYGGSPDENGETTLDAMIMDGSNLNIGAVAGLRNIKAAISVARHVLQFTRHTLLVGDQATEFAEMMGFKKESLITPKTKDFWKKWKSSNCQPNFWVNVLPNPRKSCGPYSPIYRDSSQKISNGIEEEGENSGEFDFGEFNHDTIGMIVITKSGKIFAGTSTNGAIYKIPGRVGDSPIPGSGAYANNEIGAATATGDGDILMRFLPSFTAVENLRMGLTPKLAAEDAIKRILKYYRNFVGALIVANKNGEYGAACSGMDMFPFSVYEKNVNGVVIKRINCVENK